MSLSSWPMARTTWLLTQSIKVWRQQTRKRSSRSDPSSSQTNRNKMKKKRKSIVTKKS